MKSSYQKGFTLLEALLAITILSIITGAIMAGIQLGKRAWSLERTTNSNDEFEAASRYLSSTFMKTYPKKTSVKYDQLVRTFVRFEGHENSCSFITLSEGYSQWGGLILNEIGVEQVVEGLNLSIWTKVFRDSDELLINHNNMIKTDLIKKITLFQLSYYGSQNPSQAPKWESSWVNETFLPKLISITIGIQLYGKNIITKSFIAIRQQ